jgi:protein-disulfide isomerase
MAARAHARGTPAFFVNGRVLMGAQPFEEFDSVVREEIALARRAMERGVERGRLYAHFMRNAREAPSPEAGDDEDVRPPSRPTPDPSAVYRIPVDGRPSHGRADALVTIVMFSDFQCPFCARVLPTLEQLATQYGDDVRFVYRHNPLPFHQNARPAALAAEEVFRQRGARGFFRYHDLLFANQQSLERETLLDLAAQAGANRRQVERALDEDRHHATVQADQDLAIQVGASGTPAFFINGRNLRGAQPLGAFQALIDEELVRARARVASGTPRARVYAETIANGATSPQLIGGAPAPSAPDADTVYTIPIPAEARTRGPASARVTIQVFSDFQCPFCSRLVPTLDRLVEAYPRDVRIVFRDYPLPFHTSAMPAAEAAREVFRQRGSAAFWRYHDLLFANQRQLDDDTLVRLADQVPGVRSAAVRRALEDGTHRAAIQADMQAITDAGARIGTPSSFINGRLVQGAQPYETFRAAVDRALAEP